MMTTVLVKLTDLALAPRYGEVERQNLGVVERLMAQIPLGFGQWLVAADYVLSGSLEIAIVGPPGDDRARELLEVAMSGFRPHQVVSYGAGERTQAAIPLFDGRSLVRGRAAAYVCRDLTCQAPVIDADVLRARLQELQRVEGR